MIFLGCLLTLGVAFAPRLALLLAWLFTSRWQMVFRGDWFWPLMGFFLLPYTTIMYLLIWSPTGIQGWDWMWIALGVLLDVMKWGQIANNRRHIPGYPKPAAGDKPAATSTPPGAAA